MRWRLIGTLLVGAAAFSAPGCVCAQPLQVSASANVVDGWVAEAAARFGLPERWVRKVMGVESAFQPNATSRAGAMGLMQVMPATYAELRARYGLGADPYRPHDNILAGAAYLREMYDRFGVGGFLAAYNAGPGRYTQHLVDGRPLPAETRAYVATLAGRLNIAGPAETPPQSNTIPPPSLFAVLGAAGPVSAATGRREPAIAGRGLFVALSPTSESR